MTLSKARLKYLRSLRQKKFRDQEKKFIAEGFRLVSEALSSNFAVELVLYTSDFLKKPEHARLIQGCREQGIEKNEISTGDLDSFADTVTAQGIAALVHQRESSVADLRRDSRERQLILALDSVSEPGNVGAIIRTGDWFGVSAVLLGTGTVELYNPKVVRSTMGSLFHLPIITNIDLANVAKDLRQQGFRILLEPGVLEGDARHPAKHLQEILLVMPPGHDQHPYRPRCRKRLRRGDQEQYCRAEPHQIASRSHESCQ
mgnify:CR=1 FL=1